MGKLRVWLLLWAMLPAMPAVAYAADHYEVDVDFERVIPPLPADNNGRVQVVEMFWYGCPHCYEFEPYLREWLAHKPSYVDFVRIPAVFNNKLWEIHATAFYVADVLGKLGETHEALFDALHKYNERLVDKDSLRGFYAKYGVDPATFDKTWDSFAVQAKVRRAADLSRRYGIKGVPTVIINGKYRVTGTLSKTYPNMLRIMDYLVGLEHKGEDASLQ